MEPQLNAMINSPAQVVSVKMSFEDAYWPVLRLTKFVNGANNPGETLK